MREEGQQGRGGGWGWGAGPVTGEISATHAGLGSHRGLREVWCSGELGAKSQGPDATPETTMAHIPQGDSWVQRPGGCGVEQCHQEAWEYGVSTGLGVQSPIHQPQATHQPQRKARWGSLVLRLVESERHQAG